jgi:sugar lactone lactonase YvrE
MGAIGFSKLWPMPFHSILMRSLALILAATLSVLSLTQAAPFTPGNIVVVQVGDGQGNPDTTAQPIALLEYNPNGGVVVNTIEILSFASGGSNQGGLTLNGVFSSSGMLNLSSDGRFLTVAGVDAQIGSTSDSTISPTAAHRTIARVDEGGGVEMSARLNDAFAGGEIRSAVTKSGETYYAVGSPKGSSGGMRFIEAAGGATKSTQITAGNFRHITIAKDRRGEEFLVVSDADGFSFYSGYPLTQSKPTTIDLTDGVEGRGSSFVFIDRDEAADATGMGGLDTLYWIGDSEIRKYEWTETGWATRGAAVYGPLIALTARVVSQAVEIFAVTERSMDSRLIKVTDDTAFGGSWKKSPGDFTVLATTSRNHRFCGVAFAPASVDLRDLTLSNGSLVPPFTSGICSYSATVFHESVEVSASAAQTHATVQVRVNGGPYRAVDSGSTGGPFGLRMGTNRMEVLVKGQDGITSSTYAVAVNRISAPSVEMPTSAKLEGSSVVLGGNVTSDGGAPITEVGVIYAPTSSSQDLVGQGTRVSSSISLGGIFNIPITGVVAGTSYTFKAYATNIVGTGYTQDATFATASYQWSDFAGMSGRDGTNDGSGNAARFSSPFGVTVTGNGDVYVADTYNQTIRKVSKDGVVTTLAGIPGISGSNDGLGDSARFGKPRGLAVDPSGNVYVADTSNQTIRKIAPGGLVSTLAGSPGTSGGGDGTGSAARFYSPNGVATDTGGNVYVADTYNQTIRKVTPNGEVSPLAGSLRAVGSNDGMGGARFSYPLGVAVDGTGNVYVADSGNRTIRKITSAGLVTTLAGSPGKYGDIDGPGCEARFSNPRGVAVDQRGNIYVADSNNQAIRKITPEGVVSTLGGSRTQANAGARGSRGRSNPGYPSGVAVDDAGNVYVADVHNKTIRKITRSAAVQQ